MRTAKEQASNANAADPELMADLYREYRFLVHELRKQKYRQDAALLLRLTIVMMDLGLYQPSPP